MSRLSRGARPPGLFARWASWSLALAGALLLAGCGGMPRAPEVAFAGVEWLGVGEAPGEQHFILRLTLQNPNNVKLHIETLALDLALDGVTLAQGQAEAPVDVPASGEAELALRSRGRLDKALRVWTQAKLARRDSLPYRLSGSATLTTYGVLPFDRQGEVSLSTLGRWRKGVSRDDRPL